MQNADNAVTLFKSFLPESETEASPSSELNRLAERAQTLRDEARMLAAGIDVDAVVQGRDDAKRLYLQLQVLSWHELRAVGQRAIDNWQSCVQSLNVEEQTVGALLKCEGEPREVSGTVLDFSLIARQRRSDALRAKREQFREACARLGQVDERLVEAWDIWWNVRDAVREARATGGQRPLKLPG